MKYLLILIIAVIVIATVAANSGTGRSIIGLVEKLPGKDLTGHFVIYGSLGFALFSVLNRRILQSVQVNSGWLLATALLITVEEYSQAYFPTRTFSYSDLAASLSGFAVGVGSAIFVAFCFGRKLRV